MLANRIFRGLATSGVVVLLALCNQSYGQYRGGIYRGGVNPYNTKPTVSPYLLLQNGNGATNLPQYQTLVRPFLEQQSINEFTQRENETMRRQINTLQGRATGASASPMRSTGHTTQFMNYLHYYTMRQ